MNIYSTIFLLKLQFNFKIEPLLQSILWSLLKIAVCTYLQINVYLPENMNEYSFMYENMYVCMYI